MYGFLINWESSSRLIHGKYEQILKLIISDGHMTYDGIIKLNVKVNFGTLVKQSVISMW